MSRDTGIDPVAPIADTAHVKRHPRTQKRVRSRKAAGINNVTVNALVENLKAEHEAWIAVYTSLVRSRDG